MMILIVEYFISYLLLNVKDFVVILGLLAILPSDPTCNFADAAVNDSSSPGSITILPSIDVNFKLPDCDHSNLQCP